MQPKSEKLQQGNHDVYKYSKKNIKTEESIISHSGSKQKNRNTALLLEELYIITEYIKKATKEELERVRELRVQVFKVDVSVKDPNLRRNRIGISE